MRTIAKQADKNVPVAQGADRALVFLTQHEENEIRITHAGLFEVAYLSVREYPCAHLEYPKVKEG